MSRDFPSDLTIMESIEFFRPLSTIIPPSQGLAGLPTEREGKRDIEDDRTEEGAAAAMKSVIVSGPKMGALWPKKCASIWERYLAIDDAKS